MTTPPPLTPLNRLRCARHSDREAAARCAACGLVFCRECVSEHNGRFLCAPCLAKTAAAERATAARRPTRLALLKRALALAAAAAWLWLCLYLTALLIEKIPRNFHEGTIWRTEESETTTTHDNPVRVAWATRPCGSSGSSGTGDSPVILTLMCKPPQHSQSMGGVAQVTQSHGRVARATRTQEAAP